MPLSPQQINYLNVFMQEVIYGDISGLTPIRDPALNFADVENALLVGTRQWDKIQQDSLEYNQGLHLLNEVSSMLPLGFDLPSNCYRGIPQENFEEAQTLMRAIVNQYIRNPNADFGAIIQAITPLATAPAATNTTPAPAFGAVLRTQVARRFPFWTVAPPIDHARRALTPQFKYVFINGVANSGATTIARAASGDPQALSMVGSDFATSHAEVNNRRIELQLWDITGQDRFPLTMAAYLRGNQALFLVLDITNQEQYVAGVQRLQNLLPTLDPNMTRRRILVGHRIAGAESVITEAQIEEARDSLGCMSYYAVDTSNDDGIGLMMTETNERIVTEYFPNGLPPMVEPNPQDQRGGCTIS